MRALLFLVLLTSCEALYKPAEAYDFQPGDCVDDKAWVVESRDLVGNTFYRIIERTLDIPKYIVRQCQLTYPAAQGLPLEEDPSQQPNGEICNQMESKMMIGYLRINCPRIGND